MTRIINEVFDYRTGYYTTNKGKKKLMAYIDSSSSENTFQYKDKLKNEFGASFMSGIGRRGAWVWWLKSPNDPRIETQVKPAIEFLTSVEQPSEENGQKREFVDVIDQLINDMKNASEDTDIVNQGNVKCMSKNEVTDKLTQIKEDIISTMSSKEFLDKIAPILKLRASCGYAYSIRNTLLIYIQDAKATDVRSDTNWGELNRSVNHDALRICMFRPNGSKLYGTKEAREKATLKFLESVGKESVEDLTPGEKERLRALLNSNDASRGYSFSPNWCDVRFTKQIEHKEDIYGDPSAINNLPWNSYDAEENEYMSDLIDAAISVAQKAGVNVQYKSEEELGGAKGNATSTGVINLIQNAPRNVGMLNTVIHETAHQLLHFTYLKSKNPEVKDYFVGTSAGRALVEQQAELTALVVLKELDIEDDTSLNYIAGWGGDRKNAGVVFDSIAGAATYITNNILDYFKENDKEEEND